MEEKAKKEAAEANKAIKVKAAVNAYQMREQQYYGNIIGEEKAKKSFLKERIYV